MIKGWYVQGGRTSSFILLERKLCELHRAHERLYGDMTESFYLGKENMGKIIITGAGGFVGTALTEKFIHNGYEVVAISQQFNENFPDDPLIKRVDLAIDNPDVLLKEIPASGYDAFYHLAWRGINGPEKADHFIQINNIRMVITCAAAAKQLNCKKFLCAGTISERATESLSCLSKTSGGMTYSVAKYCAHILLENYCKNVGLDYVWMQFSNIYGPQNKTGNLVSYTLDQLKNGKEALFGPALQPYDFIFVDDILEAVYRLGMRETKNHKYFIGSGASRVLKDYLTVIGEAYGRPDLIKIGARPDDGIKYSLDMFDVNDLVQDIGEYVTETFEEHIKYTIENY